VRLLVIQDEKGDVYGGLYRLRWIAKRHNITQGAEAFQTASKVIASITSSVTK